MSSKFGLVAPESKGGQVITKVQIDQDDIFSWAMITPNQDPV
ncbi:MAG: hypothetical protein ACR2OU_18055 [Thermomicrobiales bacterium]